MVLIKLTSTSREKSHDFKQEFGNFVLPGDNEVRYEMALVSGNLWYSWYNISSTLNNNIFQYSIVENGLDVSYQVIMQNGLYDMVQIKTLIQNGMNSTGHNADHIDIEPNYSTGRVEITLSNDYKVRFDHNLLYKILGFDSDSVLSSNGKHISPHNGDITNGVNDISINCDLVQSSYSNGNSSSVLYSFVPHSSPQSLLVIDPNERVYNEIIHTGGSQISSIRMFINDNEGRLVDLNNESVSYLVDIRPVKNN